MAIAMTSPERRQAPRTPAGRIAYINFEQHHGGIIVNVSQGGLCFHSIVPVPVTKTIRFWLLEQGVRIEGEGRLVWTADSQKRGGLCFANMSPEACDQLYDLASETATPTMTDYTARRGAGRPQDRRWLPISVSAIRPFRGFLGGLALGLAISALVTSAFVSHRQLGAFLIRLGERLGAKAAAPAAPVSGERREGSPAVEPPMVQPAPHPPERKPFSEPARMAASAGTLAGPRPAMQPESQPAKGKPGPQADVTRPLDDGASAAQPPAMKDRAATLPPLLGPDAVIAPPPDAVPHGLDRIPPSLSANQVIVQNDTRPENIGSTEQMYFEVGKFKQQFSAKGESDKLAGLGFPATVLERGRLWLNSYRVLVGPYYISEQAQEAYRNLVARGFEVRPFERGSRNFALPAHLTLHGSEMPVGDCDISWESYINDVKVKFKQDNYVVATAEGKWESREPKYERGATVYIQNRNGSRTLVELRFSGMRRALAFR